MQPVLRIFDRLARYFVALVLCFHVDYATPHIVCLELPQHAEVLVNLFLRLKVDPLR